MAEIIWEDPPPTASRSRSDWPAVLRPFAEHPGKWGRVDRTWKSKASPAGLAGKINKGKLPLILGRWEARVGPVGDQWGVWVVYHGQNKPARSASDSVGARRAAAAEAL